MWTSLAMWTLAQQTDGAAPTREWWVASFIALLIIGAALGISFFSSRRSHKN